ncbi:hypothetical protein U1Q18_042972 [Sarracenia purpurea var. burkii]
MRRFPWKSVIAKGVSKDSHLFLSIKTSGNTLANDDIREGEHVNLTSSRDFIILAFDLNDIEHLALRWDIEKTN